MAVDAGQQHRPCWRAGWRDEKVRQEQPLASQAVQIGSTDLTPEDPQVRIAQIVSEDDQDVWSSLGVLGWRLRRTGANA